MPTRTDLDDHLDHVYRCVLRCVARRDGTPPEPAEHLTTAPAGRATALVDRLGLDELDRSFLWAALGFAFDPRLALYTDQLGGARARVGLSPALFAELAELPPARGEELALRLATRGALVRHGLVLASDPTAVPSLCGYVPPARLLAHLRGDTEPARGLTLVRRDPTWTFDTEQSAALVLLARALMSPARPAILVEGPAGAGRRSSIAHVVGAPLMVLDLARTPLADLAAALGRLALEPRLGDVLPVIANLEALPAGDEGTAARALVAQMLDAHRGPIAITSSPSRVELPIERGVVHIGWPLASAEMRHALWSRACPEAIGDLDDLAYRYRQGPGAILRAVRAARSAGASAAPLDTTSLLAAARHDTRERMAGHAQRIETAQTWGDLVVDADTEAQVTGLIARVRFGRTVLEDWGYRDKLTRGAGIAALFSGPPGTGKTMVAGLIAKELGLELYQVDLAQVMSKWIGETEKQLGRVFDAADGGNAVLLFDEADALFAQRSGDVTNASNRYANLEVNYLLQRIEAFNGVTILTTNLAANIDRALERRLAAHVVFGAPDERARTELWRRMLHTPRAPLGDDLDPAGLARSFPALTGAHIKNAVLGAAFLAASERARTIDQRHAARAARTEHRSMGHADASTSDAPMWGES